MKVSKFLVMFLIAVVGVILISVFKPDSSGSSNVAQLQSNSANSSGRNDDDPTYAQELKKMTILLSEAKEDFKIVKRQLEDRTINLQNEIQKVRFDAANGSNKTDQQLIDKFDSLVKDLQKNTEDQYELLKKQVEDLEAKNEAAINAIKLPDHEQLMADLKAQLDQKVESVKQSAAMRPNMDVLLPEGITGKAADSNNETTAPPTSSNVDDQGHYQPYLPKSQSQSADSKQGLIDSAMAGIRETLDTASAGGPYEDSSQKLSTATARATKAKNVPTVFPVYTLPMSTALTNATLATPIIGVVPINGNINDPYFFKVVIGRENLAANGHKIPGVAKMIATGYAVGNKDQACTRGTITGFTFIFEDGRISETGNVEAGSDTQGGLGYIADPWGKPCIRGQYINNAKQYLTTRSGAAFLEGLASAYGQSQVTYQTNDSGNTQAILDGNAYNYAFSQGVSKSASEIADYIRERAADAFDVVYVKQAKPIQIFINEQIPIDYVSTARKVSYIKSDNGVNYD